MPSGGSRIRQQTFCPVDNQVVERAELVEGYEFAKDQYVRVSDDELKALKGEASKLIDITEFVPPTRSKESLAKHAPAQKKPPAKVE
jgi:non-homologous end joining protein Ku